MLSRLQRAVENITDNTFLLANFTTFNSKSIDYSILIVESLVYYEDYFNTGYESHHTSVFGSSKLVRRPVDKVHQVILKAFAAQLNPKSEQYEISDSFEEIDFVKQTEKESREGLKFLNKNMFTTFPFLLFVAFLLNSHFVVSLCTPFELCVNYTNPCTYF